MEGRYLAGLLFYTFQRISGILFDLQKSGKFSWWSKQTFVMCLTNYRSVSNLSLLRSREREMAVADRFLNVRSLPESSINAGADANGPWSPPVMAQKALSMSTSNTGAKPVSWQRSFAYLSQSMERKWASMPNGKLWTEPCCKPRCSLEWSATESLGRNPNRQRVRWRQDPSPCGWSGYSFGSASNRGQRAWQPDDRSDPEKLPRNRQLVFGSWCSSSLPGQGVWSSASQRGSLGQRI